MKEKFLNLFSVEFFLFLQFFYFPCVFCFYGLVQQKSYTEKLKPSSKYHTNNKEYKKYKKYKK